MSLYLLVIWPVCGAFAVYLIPRMRGLQKRADSVRETFVLIATAAEVLLVAFLMTEDLASAAGAFAGIGISFRFNSFGALFCLITAFTWLIVTLLSREYTSGIKDPGRFYFCYLMTLSSIIGVFLAADFFTLFLFFVMMPIVSFPLIIRDDNPESVRAAEKYAGALFTGGLFIAAGLLILYKQIGSLSYYTVLTFAPYTNQKMLLYAGILMLFGFGVQAGIYPLHTRLAAANLAAPDPVCVLLSGILAKSGLFGILTVTVYMLKSNGTWSSVLITAGAVTMVWGALCALLSSDIKKIFTYSAVSQSGLMLTGTGLFAAGGQSGGIILQMVNHSLIVPVLFGTAGVIYMNTNSYELKDIRGFGYGKPLLNAVFISGVLGISGIPLWNGYISKALIHQAVAETGLTFPDPFIILTEGLTIAYMAKVYIAVFIDRKPVSEKNGTVYTDIYSFSALIITSVMLPAIGMLPNTTAANIINYSVKSLRTERIGYFYYFNGEILMGAFISLIIGAAIYIILIRRRDSEDFIPSWLSLEKLIYGPAVHVINSASVFVCGLLCHVSDPVKTGLPDENSSDGIIKILSAAAVSVSLAVCAAALILVLL